MLLVGQPSPIPRIGDTAIINAGPTTGSSTDLKNRVANCHKAVSVTDKDGYSGVQGLTHSPLDRNWSSSMHV